MTSLDEIKKLLVVLSGAYPNYAMNDMTPAIYHRVLGEYPFAILDEACAEWIASEKWFPKPSELRDKAHELIEPQMAAVWVKDLENDDVLLPFVARLCYGRA